ncbi:MAG: family 78 glycoside hydrolase catalytic domain [Bacteroidales bacterium]|nr:family 78 glycoside hydrolase catalytic domain [Bacteroidales bacterium]
MLRSSFIIPKILIIAVIISSCTKIRNDLKLYDLRTENLSNPLGLEATSPLLSWKIKSSENGTEQSSYQILVASSKSLLNEKEADLWNPGKVASSQNFMLLYDGMKLSSRSLCYWKVRIWDQNDKPSDWSEVSVFSIGLTDQSDWQAKYIGLPDEEDYVTSPQLRKIFEINEIPDKVFLHVNSLGYHEIWINGKKAGENVLAPAMSQFNKRSLTITYDITPLLIMGRNDVVIWLGQGWYSKGLPGVSEKGPFVKAQAESHDDGKWQYFFSTDSSWTGRKSGYSTIGKWRAGDFGGELVDASSLLDDLSSVSLDKASWSPVTVTSGPAGVATPQSVEGNRIMETFGPVSVEKLRDSVWLADMGKTLTGWFEIGFPPIPEGQVIKMEYCDHLDKEGNFVSQGQEDRYISSGRGNESFCNKFNYHGFRFVKISNLAAEPDSEKMKAHLIHTDYNIASSFRCSDPDLNKIHDMVFYTLRCLSLGGYLVDCPQIERLGYGGDGNASTETAQTMFGLEPLYRNWLQAWADCIREDGGMPHTAPNPYPAGGGPYWCGFIITASWRDYVNYGNIGILEKYYPVMQKWLGYVEKYSPEGLLEPWPETDYRTWYLGDWAVPEGTDQRDPESIGLVNNCFIAVCYETMKKIATILDKPSDAEVYSGKVATIKEKIQERYFVSKGALYGSGSQIDLTDPLLAEIVPDSLKDRVTKNLHDLIITGKNGHIATGLVGVPVFTEWAVSNRETDLMYTILKSKGYPGYRYMIDNGATTTWEHWNGARSRIHNCYNGIGSWFYQALGGIRPDEAFPGYRKVTVDPQIPDGVDSAECTKDTPCGPLSLAWEKSPEQLLIKISIPVGCTAEVKIPEKTLSYRVNGVDKSPLKTETLGSGKYIIDCRLRNN